MRALVGAAFITPEVVKALQPLLPYLFCRHRRLKRVLRWGVIGVKPWSAEAKRKRSCRRYTLWAPGWGFGGFGGAAVGPNSWLQSRRSFWEPQRQ